MHRLLITFERLGQDSKTWLKESFNFVHPDDARETKNNYNAFREMGAMFKGNPAYRNVQYWTYRAGLFKTTLAPTS